MNNNIILTFNVGSSSLKIACYQQQNCVFSVNVDLKKRHAQWTGQTPPALKNWQIQGQLATDACYLSHIVQQHYATERVIAVHRIVHGGQYQQPIIIDKQVFAELERLAPLCPLHQPAALSVLKVLQQQYPSMIHIAAFDTAFHGQHNALNYSYALPLALRQQGIRAYGFHGLSCQSIMLQLHHHAPKHVMGKVLIAHLGNGSSITAVLDGVSQANSMGFSVLDGVPMGTRCGHIDAGVLLYLLAQGWSHETLSHLLYQESGLLGLSGISSDMRELIKEASPQAQFSIDYFCQRVAREIASLATVIAGCDCLVFTGGIGEHQATVRAKVLRHLIWLGIDYDEQANQAHHTLISTKKSKIKVLVLSCDEQQQLYLAAQDFI